MSAVKIIQAYAKKSLTKNQGSGITTLPSQFMAESKAGEIAAILQQAGMPLQQLDNFIRSEADLVKFLNIIKNANKPRVIPGTSAEGKAITEKLFGKKGEVVDFPQKRSFKEEIDAMRKSGDIVDEKDMVISDKITDREMFKNSNLNKEPISEKFIDYTIQDINKKEPLEGMKIANKIIKREGEFKDLTEAQSKRILKETDDHLTGKDIDYDPEDFYAKGGRISRGGGGTMGASDRGYQGGGRDSKGSVSGTAPGAAPGPGGDGPPPRVTNNPPPKSVSETVGIETVIENDINPNKFKNYLAANNKFNLQNYLDFQNQFNLLDTNKTYDEYIEMMDNDETLNVFQEDDMNKKSQEILQQFDFEKPYNEKPGIFINPEERRYKMAAKTGGRAGFYTGGITDVEPSLDDIGHGADAMNARTRLMSPGNQATTSTGLNYLLAEDNDNMRIPFSAGGGGRRAFLKLMASIGGLTAAAKSGILGLGEGTTKKAITETVKQSAGSGTPPPYFFKLVEKIKTMGDDVTVGSSTMPRQKVTRYKDYELTENVATGSKEIKKIGIEDDMITKNEYMTYTKGQADETTKGKKPADDYEEVTEVNSRIYKDNYNDPNYEDGIELKEILEEVGETVTKKADGGRIGFRVGGSGKKFIEKIFGKGSLDVMKSRDPELHKGMLEVVEMFRNRDKEGLKMYLQKFLPHMDDETIEAFIVGDAVDAAGQGKYGLDNIQGQLIRLGSGRDYAGKIKMVKDAENMRALDKLDVTDRKPNASGGLQTMLGE